MRNRLTEFWQGRPASTLAISGTPPPAGLVPRDRLDIEILEAVVGPPVPPRSPRAATWILVRLSVVNPKDTLARVKSWHLDLLSVDHCNWVEASHLPIPPEFTFERTPSAGAKAVDVALDESLLGDGLARGAKVTGWLLFTVHQDVARFPQKYEFRLTADDTSDGAHTAVRPPGNWLAAGRFDWSRHLQARAIHHRRSATPNQTASTNPNGQAPCRKP